MSPLNLFTRQQYLYLSTIIILLTFFGSPTPVYITAIEETSTATYQENGTPDKAEKLIENFDCVIHSRDDLNILYSQIKEIGEALEPLTEDSAAELKNILNEKLATVMEQLEAIYEEDGLTEEDIKTIYDIPLLADVFIGSEFDPRKLVALTFDDGPNEIYTPQILDILKKHDVKATFFALGQHVDEFPHIAKRIVDEGHTIGNHSYTHPNFANETDETILQEIEWTQESIRDATGVTPTLYRLPFGAGGRHVVKLLEPLKSIIWNIDTQDWLTKDPQKIYDNTINNLQQHSLILMHDTHQGTPDILEAIILELKEQGYLFVPADKAGYNFRYYD